MGRDVGGGGGGVTRYALYATGRRVEFPYYVSADTLLFIEMHIWDFDRVVKHQNLVLCVHALQI
jgi:hypothetical protein